MNGKQPSLYQNYRTRRRNALKFSSSLNEKQLETAINLLPHEIDEKTIQGDTELIISKSNFIKMTHYNTANSIEQSNSANSENKDQNRIPVNILNKRKDKLTVFQDLKRAIPILQNTDNLSKAPKICSIEEFDNNLLSPRKLETQTYKHTKMNFMKTDLSSNLRINTTNDDSNLKDKQHPYKLVVKKGKNFHQYRDKDDLIRHTLLKKPMTVTQTLINQKLAEQHKKDGTLPNSTEVRKVSSGANFNDIKKSKKQKTMIDSGAKNLANIEDTKRPQTSCLERSDSLPMDKFTSKEISAPFDIKNMMHRSASAFISKNKTQQKINSKAIQFKTMCSDKPTEGFFMAGALDVNVQNSIKRARINNTQSMGFNTLDKFGVSDQKQPNSFGDKGFEQHSHTMILAKSGWKTDRVNNNNRNQQFVDTVKQDDMYRSGTLTTKSQKNFSLNTVKNLGSYNDNLNLLNMSPRKNTKNCFVKSYGDLMSTNIDSNSKNPINSVRVRKNNNKSRDMTANDNENTKLNVNKRSICTNQIVIKTHQSDSKSPKIRLRDRLINNEICLDEQVKIVPSVKSAMIAAQDTPKKTMFNWIDTKKDFV